MVSTTSPSLGLSEDPGSGSSGLGRGIGAWSTPCRHVLPHALSPILQELPVSRGTEGSQNVGLDQSPAVNFTWAGELAISLPGQRGWDTSKGGKAHRGSHFGILFHPKTLVS